MPKMDCPTEEQLIRRRIGSMPGVRAIAVDLLERRLTVTHDLDDPTPIEAALAELGMDPRPLERVSERFGAAAVDPIDRDARAAPGPARIFGLAREHVALGASGLFALGAEILALTTRSERAPVVIALAVTAMLVGGRDTLKKGLLAVRNRTLNINFLMTIAIGGAVAIGEWPEAAMVTFLFAVAEAIEALSLDRARNAIRALMQMSPPIATVRRGDEWVVVSAAEVTLGARVRVRPGERIPADGRLVAGSSTVNQAPITGESLPVDKQVGDHVFAGTLNEVGSIEIEVTANPGDTTLARIVRAVQSAQAERAPTQRFVDRFARVYTPAVVGVAVLVAALPTLLLHEPFAPWLYKALVLLVIACPCALVISTPVTVVSGLAAAARMGILVKGGVYLEEGRKLSAIALDKTGTLTRGQPAVTDVAPLAGHREDEVVALAASLDAHSDHPVARAVVARYVGVLEAVTGFRDIPGHGVSGEVDGVRCLLGSHALLEREGVCSPSVEAELARLELEGKTAIGLVRGDVVVGVMAVADTVRDTSLEAVRRMHGLGLSIVMLSGDNARTAAAIGRAVGIEDVRGNLMPDDKVAAVAQLMGRYGHVGMVGDGVNDAPALAKASVGFAMGAAGSDTALETADVALMHDDLRRLPDFIELSRATGAILTQNVAVAIGIKAVFFALSLVGVATLWMAVFADMGASLLVVFNGLRLLGRASATSAVVEQEHAKRRGTA